MTYFLCFVSTHIFSLKNTDYFSHKEILKYKKKNNTRKKYKDLFSEFMKATETLKFLIRT